MRVTNISFANYCSWKQFALVVRSMSIKVVLMLLKQVGGFIKFFKPEVFMKTGKWLLASHLEFKRSVFKSAARKICLFKIWFKHCKIYFKRSSSSKRATLAMVSSVYIVPEIVVSKFWIILTISACFTKTIFPPAVELHTIFTEWGDWYSLSWIWESGKLSFNFVSSIQKTSSDVLSIFSQGLMIRFLSKSMFKWPVIGFFGLCT